MYRGVAYNYYSTADPAERKVEGETPLLPLENFGTRDHMGSWAQSEPSALCQVRLIAAVNINSPTSLAGFIGSTAGILLLLDQANIYLLWVLFLSTSPSSPSGYRLLDTRHSIIGDFCYFIVSHSSSSYCLSRAVFEKNCPIENV